MNIKKIIKCVNNDILHFDSPKNVVIKLSCGRGVDAEPIVKVGEKVMQGQTIAVANKSFLSNQVSSSISGIVKDVVLASRINEGSVHSIEIESDEKNTCSKKMGKLKNLDIKSFRKRLQDCGVYGCGGAGFPSYAKIKKEVNYKALVVNACVSETNLCSALACLIHFKQEIASAVKFLVELLQIKNVYIVTNKFVKSKKMNFDIDIDGVIVSWVYMSNKPNQGDESIICKKIFNYDKNGSFPAYEGILVYDAQTLKNINSAISGEKIVKHILTLSGGALKENVNVEVPIGVNVLDVVQSLELEVCPLEEFEQMEKQATDKYFELCNLRQEYKTNKEENFVKHFIEFRKETNTIIFNFLKYEQKNKKYLRNKMIVNGTKYGREYNTYSYHIHSNVYGIEFSDK